MRALNPTLSKLTTVKEDDDKTNKLSQPKLRSVSSRRSIIPATAASSRSSSAPTATAAATASSSSSSTSTLTPKPRPSSRQSAVSSSTLTAANNNNNNNNPRKPGALKPHTTPSDPQRTQRNSTATAPRPPVITTTVTRNPRLAAAAAAKKPAPKRPAPLNLTSAPSSPAAPKSSPAVILSPASTVSNSSPISTSSHATAISAQRSRDQNAPQMTQHSSISKPGRMPLDRASGTNTNGTPRMPTLSATSARGATGRVPLTPKIASKSTPTTATAPANARTPLSRAAPRPTVAGSAVGGSTLSTAQQDDDGPTLLSTNITPRSGKRQHRVNSANTTPNGTPNPERSADGWDHDTRSGLGITSSPMQGDFPKRAHVTFNSIPTEAKAQPRQDAHNDPDAKFFYASDAKGTQQQHHQQQAPVARPVLAKAPTFFYANGSTVDNKAQHSTPASPALAQNSPQDSMSNKFMYANGMPELRTSQPGRSSRPSSVISTTSRAAPTSRPNSISQPPTSPIKQVQQPFSAQKRNSNPPSAVSNRPQAASPPPPGPPSAVLRRSSNATSRKSHSRSSSMVSGSLVMGDPARSSWHSSGPASPSIDAALNPPPLTLASIIQAAKDFADPDESMSTVDDAQSETHSEVQSPARSTHDADPISDLVANARRERKVQDLQITNASLEAINRTLERQLRKQTAELRRFKRLSRAGRLSMMPVPEPTGAGSETGSTNGGDDQEVLSDLSEGDEPEDLVEEEDSLTDDDTGSDDPDLSASMVAEKDEKYRKKDEKRLEVDLSKHQQLLIDSQKINQSIKRCMDWTEELIKEGRKALEYSVRPYEVEIPGPRVLNPVDEFEEDTTQTSVSFDFSPEDTINLEEDLTGPNAPITPRLAGWKQESNPMDRVKGAELPTGSN